MRANIRDIMKILKCSKASAEIVESDLELKGFDFSECSEFSFISNVIICGESRGL